MMNRKKFLISGALTGGLLLGSSRMGRLFASLAPGQDAFNVSVSTQAPLPYAFDALEPIMDAQTLEIHYSKHHAGYLAKLTQALTAEPTLLLQPLDITLAKLNEQPEAIRTAIRHNGGGHYNHSFFWHILQPVKDNPPPSEKFNTLINTAFGNFEEFKKAFDKVAASRFGSGWAWLVKTPDGKLVLSSTPEQDNPLMPDVEVKGTPLLCLDVWEHAYYLKYQNRRTEYIDGFWKLVHWPAVEALAGL